MNELLESAQRTEQAWNALALCLGDVGESTTDADRATKLADAFKHLETVETEIESFKATCAKAKAMAHVARDCDGPIVEVETRVLQARKALELCMSNLSSGEA